MSERRKISLGSVLIAGLALSGGAMAGGKKEEAQKALDQLKSLAGTWQGTASEGEESFPAEIQYRVTGAGSTVVETMFPGTPHEMVSVYHLDGDALVMTHYCMGNQPKLALVRSTTPAELKFDFVGGTNIDPKGMHIHAGAIRPLEKDALEEDWVAWVGGKPTSPKKLRLTRKGAAPAPTGGK